MNIFIVSPGYPTISTIDFIFVDQLCRAISKMGIRVTVIAPQSLTKSLLRNVPIIKWRSEIQVNNGKHITLYRPVFITFGNFKIFKKLNKKNYNNSVIQTIKKIKFKPDVCYGHFWEAAYAIYPYAKKYDIPLFVSSGEEEITINKDKSLKELENFIKYVNGVICVSTKNKNEIIALKLANESNCVVIPNSIDPTKFHKKNKSELRKKLDISKDDFIVVFLGQFNERKGVMRVSDALTKLNDRTIKAIFIGAGSDKPNYKDTIFKGALPHNQVPNYLNCADIFVLPSHNEGCPNSVVEAMACGLPIVSSDLPFNYDILDSSNAILVNPFDITAIASAIKCLKDNEDLRMKMSYNALKASSKLTLHERAKGIIKYINSRNK